MRPENFSRRLTYAVMCFASYGFCLGLTGALAVLGEQPNDWVIIGLVAVGMAIGTVFAVKVNNLNEEETEANIKDRVEAHYQRYASKDTL